MFGGDERVLFCFAYYRAAFYLRFTYPVVLNFGKCPFVIARLLGFLQCPVGAPFYLAWAISFYCDLRLQFPR